MSETGESDAHGRLAPSVVSKTGESDAHGRPDPSVVSETGEGDGVAGHDPLGLGLRFKKEAPGLVARFDPGDEHRGPPGFLHGGVAAAVLDETMASLGWALDDVPCVTATLSIKYRQPVPLDGRPVRIEVWRANPEPRRTQRVQGRLLLSDGTVAVEATGIFVQKR